MKVSTKKKMHPQKKINQRSHKIDLIDIKSLDTVYYLHI